MANPPTPRSAANIAAAMMVVVATGGASVAAAQAAQLARAAMQHGAPFHRAAPVFRASPVQYGPPHGGNAGRPVHIAPAFTPPAHNSQVNPAPHHINPELHLVHPRVPLDHPGALGPNVPGPGVPGPGVPGPRVPGPGVSGPGVSGSGVPGSGLPLNNPSALRPNFPLGNPGGHQPNPTPNPAATGLMVPLNNSNPVQQGAIPSPGADIRPPAGQSSAPVSQPVVLRPLSKAPPGGSLHTQPTFPAAHAHDRFWPLHKDSRFVWLHGQRRLFTPVALLGVVLIGDSYWYPDAYVSAEGPACTGYTADGCQLQWRMVGLEDGGAEPQCVQYCPQAGPPPAQAATLPPPAPIPEGGVCQTTIYSEPNFRGNSAPTGDSQAVLSPSGWRNEIASIVVRAGTWDFFADENFSGETLRLGPGTYPMLAPEWTRHIGSFMCVEPGQPPA